jgi:hypothetical protein
MANLKLQTSVAADVVPSNTVNIAYPGDDTTSPNNSKWPCVLYIGTSGNIKVRTAGGNEITFVGVSGFFPVQVVRVFATGTTATNIVALW